MKSLKNSRNSNLCLSHGGGANQKSLLQEHVISKLSRKDLEDKYYKEYEKNICLKKQLNAQKQKIKEQSAKIIRASEQIKQKDYIYFLASKFLEGSNSEDGQCDILTNNNKKDTIENKLIEPNNDFQRKKQHLRVNFLLETPLTQSKLEKINEQSSTDDDEESINADFDSSENSSIQQSFEEVVKNTKQKSENLSVILNETEKVKGNIEEDCKEITDIQSLQIENLQLKNFIEKNIKNEQTQTVDNYISEISSAKDLLIQELAEEHLKVLELSHQVNSMKLSHSILNKVDERLEKLQKESKESLTVTQMEIKNKNINSDANQNENLRLLELTNANIDMKNKIQMLKNEIDLLVNKVKIYEKVNPDDRIEEKDMNKQKGYVCKKCEGKVKLNKSNTSEIPLQTVTDENKTLNLIEENQVKINDLPTNLNADESKEIPINVNEDKTPKSEVKLNDDSENADDATYDISKHSQSDDSSSINEYISDLSDGEVPQKEKSKSVKIITDAGDMLKTNSEDNKKSVLSTEEAIHISSIEIKECERLLDMTKSVIDLKNIDQKDEGPSSPILEDVSVQPEIQSENIDEIKTVQLTLNIYKIELNEKFLSFINEDMIYISWRFNDCEMIYSPIKSDLIIETHFETAINLPFNNDLQEEKISIQIHKTADKDKVELAKCEFEIKKMFAHVNKKFFLNLNLIVDDNIKSQISDSFGILSCTCYVSLINSAGLKPIIAHSVCTTSEDDNMMEADVNDQLHLKKRDSGITDDSSRASVYPNFGDLPKNDSRKLSFSKEKGPRHSKKKSVSENFGDFKLFDLISHMEPVEKSQPSTHNSDTLIVTLLWIKFNEHSDIIKNKNITLIYVEYLLLPEDNGLEIESMSIKKPNDVNESAHFNFYKEFNLDSEKNYINRLKLLSVLSVNNDDEENYIPFTIVSEPVEDPLGLDDCKELGWGKLCITNVLEQMPNDDSAEIHLNIYSADNNILIGELVVQIDGLDLLRRLQKEVH